MRDTRHIAWRHHAGHVGYRPGRRVLAVALWLLCLCAGSGTATAQSAIRVPQDYSTIQTAINAAANGDTVPVAPGVYVENINFMGKGITLVSAGGANVTVIDGNSAGSVVTFANGESGSAKLKGFTIRNGRADFDGGGIQIASASPVITEKIIVGINAPAAISITGGEYSINGAAVTSNPGKIENGQSVAVRLTASANFATQMIATLTDGAASANFRVTTQALSTEYFPLTVGSTWTMSSGGSIGTATTSAGNVSGIPTIGRSDPFDGSISYYAADSNGVHLHQLYFPPSFVDGCGTVAERDTFSPPVTVLPASGTVGQTVQSTGTVLAVLEGCTSVTLPFSSASTLQSFERVTIPAGQFETLRVGVTISIASIGSQSSTAWFAPGIGIVKSLNPDGTVHELVSTNIVRTAPDAIAFNAQSDVAINSSVISNPATITGITSAAAVSITGGEYSINGGAFTSSPGSVTNAQSIRVRLTTSPQPLTSTLATLTVGGVAAIFSATTALSVPAAPTSVSASSSIGSIILMFAPPASDGGAAITGYTATCTSANGGALGSNTGSFGTTSIRVEELTNGRTYTCTISASNSAGEGPSSAPSNVVTPFDITPILNLLLSD